MDLQALLIIAAFVYAAYLASLLAYRLVLSPLAKYPGPKIAAASNWYEFYYDVIKQGNFTAHIQTLHDKYGMFFELQRASHGPVLVKVALLNQSTWR